jgi:hypothetical protein
MVTCRCKEKPVVMAHRKNEYVVLKPKTFICIKTVTCCHAIIF